MSLPQTLCLTPLSHHDAAWVQHLDDLVLRMPAKHAAEAQGLHPSSSRPQLGPCSRSLSGPGCSGPLSGSDILEQGRDSGAVSGREEQWSHTEAEHLGQSEAIVGRPNAELEGAKHHPVPLSGLQRVEWKLEDLKSGSALVGEQAIGIQLEPRWPDPA